jgi:tetratricopeptide (TPR) repeat protein
MIKTIKQFSLLTACCLMLLAAACTGSKTAQNTNPSTVSPTITAKSKKGVDTAAIERDYIDACKFMALGEYTKAVELLNKIVKQDPSNDASYYQLSRIYFDFGQASDALSYIKSAVNLKPENNEYLLQYADILGYSASYLKAAEVYTVVVKSGKANDETYYRLAYSYEKANKIDDAIKTMMSLKDIIGKEEGVVFELQRLYALKGNYESAITWMKELIEMNPGNTTYMRFLSEYYEKNNQPELAAETFDILLATDTNNTDLQFKKASLFQKSGEQKLYYDTMRKAFLNSAGNIDTKIFYLVLFVDSIDKKQFVMKDSVLKWTEYLVTAHADDAKSFAMRGDFLFYGNALESAAANYSKSIQLRSDIFDVWIKMFYIWSDLRKYDSLVDVSATAIELYPNQPVSYYFNAIGNNQLKQYNEAIKVLKRGLPLTVSNQQLRADMFTQLGDAYHELGNHVESDKAFESSIEIVADNPYTLNNYAYYLSVRNEKLERAAEMSLQSIRIVPDNPSFEDTYGWILYQQKKYTEAEKWINNSLRNGGDRSGVVNEHYGDVLYQLGDKEKAVEYWKKAKQLGEASDLIDKKINDKMLYE